MAGPRDYAKVFTGAGSELFEAAGRYLHVMAAPSGSVFLSIDDGSELERVSGEGIYIGEGFKRFKVRSAVAQTVRLMVAEEPQVTGGGSSGAGATPTVVSETPSATVSSLADNAIAAATTENIAANLTRRRITIGVLSTESVGVRVRASGAPASSGIEIQPGTFVEFRTTAALEVRNDDAAVATSYYIFEES